MAQRSRLSQSIFGFKVLCEDPEQKEPPIKLILRQLELNRFLGILGYNGKKIRQFAIERDRRTVRIVLSAPIYGAESIDFYLANDETELTAEHELYRFWEYERDQIARWDSQGEFTKPRVEVYGVDDLQDGLAKVCLRAFPEYIGTEKQVWDFVKPSPELPFCINVQRLFEAVNGTLSLRRVGTDEDAALECRTDIDDETGRLVHLWALYQPMN